MTKAKTKAEVKTIDLPLADRRKIANEKIGKILQETGLGLDVQHSVVMVDMAQFVNKDKKDEEKKV